MAKVGVPVGGVTESVIAGDVQIDLLLNDDGSLVADFLTEKIQLETSEKKLVILKDWVYLII